MRKVLSLLLLLIFPVMSYGSWGYVPLETLVQESDLIVVGTLHSVSEYSEDGIDYGQGTITVKEVLWGQAMSSQYLLLKWQNSSDIICPRVEHSPNVSEEGIWLLTRDGDAVRADYPERFVELTKRYEVFKALAVYPVILRSASFSAAPSASLPFAIVFRNYSDTPRIFSGVDVRNGVLLLGAKAKLDVRLFKDGNQQPAKLSKRVESVASISPVVVPPWTEISFDLNLQDLLQIAPEIGESYDLQLFVSGCRPSNEIGFYIDDSALAETTKPAAELGVHKPAPTAQTSRLSSFARAVFTFLSALALYFVIYKSPVRVRR